LTPLICAIIRGYEKVVDLLLSSGAGVNTPSGGDESTPLMHAAAHGHASLVKVLLERGGDVHALDNQGNTALTIAAAGGSTEIVGLLLARGSPIDRQDDKVSAVWTVMWMLLMLMTMLILHGGSLGAV
jgi:uncharacterized protein